MPSALPYKEQAFEVTQEHFNIALNQVQLGFWELDLNNYVLNCTSKCKTNIGIMVDDILDYDTLLACILLEDRILMPEAIIKAIQSTDGIYSLEYRVRHADQSIHWIDAKGTVLFEGEVPSRIIGTMVDITEKKDLELLRDELFNVTTHELKTPLSAVKGYLQLLDRFITGLGNEKITQVVKRALGSVERITRLLNEMADPVNLYSNQIRLAKDYFDLNALAEEIAGNAMLINPYYRIEQVIVNLLTNAVKYSPGKNNVVIRSELQESMLHVSIQDFGIGIEEKYFSELFGRFYRVNADHRFQGLGLGLFISAEIIKRHGGDISVKSELGKGSVFSFRIPAIVTT
jgi:PAS domain S-box-containing protein